MHLIKMHQIKALKINPVEIIASFLSMEEEGLNAKQISSILKHQPVQATQNEIREVKNLSHICRHLSKWNSLSRGDFKRAHQVLMKGLDQEGGYYRKETVVVVEGKKITHIPPMPSEIPDLMREQFDYSRHQKNIPWLIKACVFHYGVQYIHPFVDGNGRMGRIWQHLILLKVSPIFQYVLIGNLIKQNASAYYLSLDKSDKKKNARIFIEFCLQKITHELKRIAKKHHISSFVSLSRYYEVFTKYKGSFGVKEYHAYFKHLSLSTIRKDLQQGRRFAQYFKSETK